jgi:uncharacterized protein
MTGDLMADYPVGSIGWTDLTVPDAGPVRDFYARVVGWRAEPVSMGDYDDFNMVRPSDGQPAAGVCHARGANAQLPGVWLIYVVVESLDASLAQVRALGGRVIGEPRSAGTGRFAVIADPAGAVCGLYEQGRA